MQILHEERSLPTVNYELDPTALAAEHSGDAKLLVGMAALLNSKKKIAIIRSQRPRQVQEHPHWWTFKSVNFDLLCALYTKIPEDSKSGFVQAMLDNLASSGCGRSRPAKLHTNWNGFVSELPLIAEFCLRNGVGDLLLQKLSVVRLSPGKALLLRHLEDTVALNFTIFTDTQYQKLELFAKQLYADSTLRLRQSRAARSVEESRLFLELAEAATGLAEECRKARYLYLKCELLEGLNLEVNQDKDAVRSHLERLGFPQTLVRSLDEAERLYHSKGNEFNLKSSMGLLRSFLEDLQKEILPAAHAKFNGKAPRKWGEGLLYLRTHGVLSQAEEAFAASLYTLMSDEAVHPIIAEREYARLFRNVVIEYALLFLSKLDKIGLKR